jgi:hypothetical protein
MPSRNTPVVVGLCILDKADIYLTRQDVGRFQETHMSGTKVSLGKKLVVCAWQKANDIKCQGKQPKTYTAGN